MIMSSKVKKSLALFLIAILSVTSVQVNVFAMNAPRVAVHISMSTDADKSGNVEPEEEITATVTWKGMFASTGEPVTIQVTNGAEILVYNEEDVDFQANGVPAAIKSVTRTPSGDSVTFTSGTPAASPLENKISFKIKAPSTTGSFNLSAKIGLNTTPNNPQTNFVEEEFNVNPLRLNTTLDVIDQNDSFEVFGSLAFDDAFMLAMQIYNKETGSVAFETTTTDISREGKFTLGTYTFDDSHATGVYTVEIVLFDSNFTPIATAKKEIEHLKSYHEISYVYKCIETGKTIDSYSLRYKHGEEITLIPDILEGFQDYGYTLKETLLNGEPVEGDNLQLAVTEPAEVVFLYNAFAGVTVNCKVDGRWQGNGELTFHSLGSIITITAPDKPGYKLASAWVDSERATIINDNQVEVTVTGNMLVDFIYERM